MTNWNPERDSLIEFIADVFERRAATAYLGEAVTMTEHMLQAATLASEEGAADHLVVAALLHDIGYFTDHIAGQSPDDRRHEADGAKALAEHFPPAVAECVRLHVAAKRYLCATDPTYHDQLSTASKLTLDQQGGPMSEAEVVAFESLAWHRDAVRVRLWDDRAKIPGAPTMTFDQFLPLLLRG